MVSPPRSIAPILVVIVNYRTPALTIDCLRWLEPEVASVPGTRVVVVDNGSGDGSAERIAGHIAAAGWSAWATLVAAERNGGFAHGNNRGIEAGGPARYTLLLNSDTIVHPGCLRRCLRIMEADPGIGVLGCLLVGPDGLPQAAARRFPTPLRVLAVSAGLPWRFPRLFGWADTNDPDWDRARTARDAEWLCGAFLFIRAGVLERIGGLDEDFFFYGEDIEFCHRVRRAGYRCRYDPSASITHLGGASSDPTRLPVSARNVHAWRARYLVQRKCYGWPGVLAVRAADLLACAGRMAWMRALGRHAEPRYAELRDMLSLARQVGGAA